MIHCAKEDPDLATQVTLTVIKLTVLGRRLPIQWELIRGRIYGIGFKASFHQKIRAIPMVEDELLELKSSIVFSYRIKNI